MPSRKPTFRQFLARRRAASAPITVVPVRVRRLMLPALVADAYGARGPDVVPYEVVDLSDGTRLCEYADGRTRRFAGEDHVWRYAHACARGVAGNRPDDEDDDDDDQPVAPLPDLSEGASGPTTLAARAWFDRPDALRAARSVGLAGPLPLPEWVAVPGEGDGRRLDVLGRRNAGATLSRRRADGARTLTP